MRNVKPPKQHWMGCPSCGAQMHVYRSYPTAKRIRRLKLCTNCKKPCETVELTLAEYDDLLRRLNESFLPVAHKTIPSIVQLPGEPRI